MGRWEIETCMGEMRIALTRPLRESRVASCAAPFRERSWVNVAARRFLLMAPRNKRQRHLQRLVEEKKQRLAIERADLELTDVVLNDDEFDLDGMPLDDNLVQRRLEDVIKWNPAANDVMRAAYTGDSRATSYRRAKEKEQRHRSVADCPKIHTFFPSSQISHKLCY